MSTSLPERPDLDQLRRQAKELRDGVRRGDARAEERFARQYGAVPARPVRLAAAQLVVARELGFASWPRLKFAVEDRTSTPDARAESFVGASVEHRMGEAASILEADSTIAARSISAAAALGDAGSVRSILRADPSMVTDADEARGWPPLLYACYSGWQEIDPSRAAGMAEVVRVLLDAGASPNTNNGARNGYRSALSGAVQTNNAAVVQVLLDKGANSNDGQCIGEAAGHRDHRCLELLLSHGARVAGTWALGAAVYADDPEAVSLLLEGARAALGDVATQATDGLADAAAAHACHEVVAVLLAAGADPETIDSDVGLSALRGAVRAGRVETAALLSSYGATDDSTDVDRLLGACWRADRAAAERLLAEHPDLLGRLTNEDRAVVVEAAGSGLVATVALMLDVGFSPDDRNGQGEQPLHTAAYNGNAEVVRLLIEADADVDARDARFESTPLAFAAVGSGERGWQHPGSWVETVELLIEAGASRQEVWISDKPPSEDVGALLRRYGVTPDEQLEPDADDADDVPRSMGSGVTADIARHLESAYRHADLDLLGSLLHPRVQWTGLCTTSEQLLDWYRNLVVDGTRASVETVEVDRGAVLLGITVSRPAEGARPAPPERLYQVFTIDDAQIVQIHGYPDRASALKRA
ncbi:MAG TPA: ankyrin repeat domain-containing protein [Acidimicrobiales bacterium]|nr:ankyrin repeat domain-containing protein [Acidimicrobiales bacterium]